MGTPRIRFEMSVAAFGGAGRVRVVNRRTDATALQDKHCVLMVPVDAGVGRRTHVAMLPLQVRNDPQHGGRNSLQRAGMPRRSSRCPADRRGRSGPWRWCPCSPHRRESTGSVMEPQVFQQHHHVALAARPRMVPPTIVCASASGSRGSKSYV